MKKISTAQLQRNVRFQLDAMDDLCNIYNISRSSGTFGTHSSQTRTIISGVPCGIDFPQNIERNLKQGTEQLLLMDYDCILRVATDQTIQLTDEIELVEKGEILISGTFRPVNLPTVNSSVQKVQLKRVVA
jgi:hypothetical protein